MFYFKKKVYLHGKKKKKVKSRFKHVLHDIFKKFFKHNYNIMVETVLTIKKTVNNLFGVNPFFGPNLTILYLQNTPKGAVRSLHHSAP
jgi:hypothetical protein